MNPDQRSNNSTPVEEDDDISQLCKKCGLTINEGHAYELGDDRWHIHCFSCSKCSKLLGCNSNFLVLGNGSLVCSECSYACNNCGKKIDDLAILTGDQAYCSSCFKCRSCKKKILDLKYARTSKGLFCMSCHEKLVERKKKHDKLKKEKRKSSLRNSILVPKTDENVPKSFNGEKLLPQVPPKPSSHEFSNSPPQSEFSITKDYLDYSNSKSNLINQQQQLQLEMQFDQLQKSQYEYELHNKKHNESNKSEFRKSAFSDIPIAPNQILPISNNNSMNGSSNNSQTHNSSIEELENYNSTADSTTMEFPVLLNQTPLISQTPTLAPAAELHKNSLAPRQPINNNNSLGTSQKLGLDDIRQRELSPYNNINRKAIVLESQQSLDSVDLMNTNNNSTATANTMISSGTVNGSANYAANISGNLSNTTPSYTRDKTSPSRGLNIQGLDPSITNSPQKSSSKFFSFGNSNTTNANNAITNGDDTGNKLTRSKSILSPKFSIKHHKHQRSISGSKFPFGDTNGINNNVISTPSNANVSRSATMKSMHSRGHSDTNTAVFTTPPLPPATSSIRHSRSASENSFDYSSSVNLNKLELEAKSLKNEVHNLNITKNNLTNEVDYLQRTKDVLSKELEELNLEISNRRKVLEASKSENSGSNVYNNGGRHSHSSSNTEGFESPPISHSSTLLNPSVLSSPLLDENVSIEVADVQKAGRLKPRFWRRPKLTNSGMNGNKIVNSQSNFSISSNLNDNSGYGINNINSNSDKGLSSFISKSRSTNLLDTMLTNNSNNSNGRSSKEFIPLIGSTLETRSKYEGTSVPLIITKCLQAVEERGLDIEGIYRISGGNSSVEKIEKAFANLNFSNDEKQMKLVDELISGDIHSVTTALKRYLRKLSDPVIASSCYEAFIRCSSKNKDNLDKKIKDLSKVMGQLPEANRMVLYLLTRHLSLVVAQQDVNRMNIKNLAVVFSPTLARDESGEREIVDMQYRNESTETLLRHHDVIFKEFY